jgi:cytoskeleton protein RodZ
MWASLQPSLNPHGENIGYGFPFMAKGNFGERLKREREMREVSLSEVTSATRIGARFLEALENEDWDKLPGGAFNRGFVRSVARYLGLDEENLLAEYDLARTQESAKTPHAHQAENRIPTPPKWPAIVAVLVVILVIAGLVAAGVYGWRRYSEHRQKQQSSMTSPRATVSTSSPITPVSAQATQRSTLVSSVASATPASAST